MVEMFGFTLLNGNFKNSLCKTQLVTLFNNLVMTVSTESHDAIGVTMVNDTDITILKREMSPSKLVSSQEYLEFINKIDLTTTYSVLGYSKTRTVGKNTLDYPLVTESVVGMLDGSVTNSTDIFDIFKVNIKKSTTVEGEAVFRLFDYYKNTFFFNNFTTFKRIYENIRGFSNYICVDAFAPSSVFITKNSACPMHMSLFRDSGIVIYAASQKFIDQIANLSSLTGEEKIDIPMHSSTALCADSNSYETVLL